MSQILFVDEKTFENSSLSSQTFVMEVLHAILVDGLVEQLAPEHAAGAAEHPGLHGHGVPLLQFTRGHVGQTVLLITLVIAVKVGTKFQF